MSQKEVISLHYVLPVVTVYWYLVEEVESYSQGPFIPNKCLNAACLHGCGYLAGSHRTISTMNLNLVPSTLMPRQIHHLSKN